MKTIITEVFFRDVPVGRVISQAVLTLEGEKVVGVPFDYRPGYRMAVMSSTDNDKGLMRACQTAQTKRKKSIEARVQKVLSPELRQELERRLRILEHEYVQRLLATIQEFECAGGDPKYE